MSTFLPNYTFPAVPSLNLEVEVRFLLTFSYPLISHIHPKNPDEMVHTHEAEAGGS